MNSQPNALCSALPSIFTRADLSRHRHAPAGQGTIISQTCASPCVDDEVVTTIEVIELIERGRRAKLRCECRVGETPVLEGEAEVKAPAKPA